MIHKTRPLTCTPIFVFVRLCSVTWAAPNPASCSMLTDSTRGEINQKTPKLHKKKRTRPQKTSSHTLVNIIQQHMMVNEQQHNLPSAPRGTFTRVKLQPQFVSDFFCLWTRCVCLSDVCMFTSATRSSLLLLFPTVLGILVAALVNVPYVEL